MVSPLYEQLAGWIFLGGLICLILAIWHFLHSLKDGKGYDSGSSYDSGGSYDGDYSPYEDHPSREKVKDIIEDAPPESKKIIEDNKIPEILEDLDKLARKIEDLLRRLDVDVDRNELNKIHTELQELKNEFERLRSKYTELLQKIKNPDDSVRQVIILLVQRFEEVLKKWNELIQKYTIKINIPSEDQGQTDQSRQESEAQQPSREQSRAEEEQTTKATGPSEEEPPIAQDEEVSPVSPDEADAIKKTGKIPGCPIPIMDKKAELEIPGSRDEFVGKVLYFDPTRHTMVLEKMRIAMFQMTERVRYIYARENLRRRAYSVRATPKCWRNINPPTGNQTNILIGQHVFSTYQICRNSYQYLIRYWKYNYQNIGELIERLHRDPNQRFKSSNDANKLLLEILSSDVDTQEKNQIFNIINNWYFHYWLFSAGTESIKVLFRMMCYKRTEEKELNISRHSIFGKRGDLSNLKKDNEELVKILWRKKANLRTPVAWAGEDTKKYMQKAFGILENTYEHIVGRKGNINYRAREDPLFKFFARPGEGKKYEQDYIAIRSICKKIESGDVRQIDAKWTYGELITRIMSLNKILNRIAIHIEKQRRINRKR